MKVIPEKSISRFLEIFIIGMVVVNVSLMFIFDETSDMQTTGSDTQVTDNCDTNCNDQDVFSLLPDSAD